MRVLTIIGTRPEAIKLAPVLKQFRINSRDIESLVCVTGQHREMLDQMLNLFDIRPDIDLDIMQPRQHPSQSAALVLEKMDPVLTEYKPDWMLVQGDTTTVMAAAIAAHHRRVRTAHVEAGLRSHDRANPFPEEMNRVVADHVCDLHFAPTQRARTNLLKEGIAEKTIFVTGNTAVDSLLEMIEDPIDAEDRVALATEAEDILLVTAHRRENHGQPLQQICQALAKLSRRDGLHIVYAVHRNPAVWDTVHGCLGDEPGISLLPPLGYRSMLDLMQRSKLILTDSGGIQEEAPTIGVPVLVLREVTERPEAVLAGAARVVGTDPDRIVSEVNRLLDDEKAYAAMSQVQNPFGDGRAAERIAAIIAADGTLPPGMDEWSAGDLLSSSHPAGEVGP